MEKTTKKLTKTSAAKTTKTAKAKVATPKHHVTEPEVAKVVHHAPELENKPIATWIVAGLAGAASLTLAEGLQLINLSIGLPFYIVALLQLVVAGLLTQELFKGQKIYRSFVFGATVTILVEFVRVSLSALVTLASGWSKMYNQLPTFGYGSTTVGSIFLAIVLGALVMMLAVYLTKRVSARRPNLVPAGLIGLVALLIVLPLSYLLFIAATYNV